MKYLILSDIHGSITNLIKVLEKESFDRLLLLGDILPHGPRNDLPFDYNPKKIIEILNPLSDKIICVRGNCDAEVDDMVLNFPILNLACVVNQNINYYLTHGHRFNPSNKLNVKNSVILFGHSHISCIEKVDSNIYINPGSLGIPKDNHASYAVIDNNIVCIKSVNGDILKSIDLNKEVLCN